MARFDVYGNSGKFAPTVPYLLDVQSDFVSGLPTRLVIPLRRRATLSKTLPSDLCPLITVEGEQYFLAPAEMGAVPVGVLQQRVMNVSDRSLEIGSALDLIFGHP